MAADWHYTHGGRQHGPISSDQLRELARSGGLQPSDTVWREGLDGWTPAGRVRGLFPSAPPPVPPEVLAASSSSAAPPPAGGAAPAPPHDGPPPRKPERPAVARTFKRVKTAAEFAGTLLAVVGPVGDFLKPLAPINLPIFAIASAVGILLFVLWVKRVRVFGRPLGVACFFFLLVGAGFGVWWGLGEFNGGEDKGFLAEHIGVVDHLQSVVISSRKVEGGKLFTQAAAELDKEQDARKIVRQVFDGFPGNVMRAEPVGEPRIVEKKGNEATVAVAVRIGVDPDKYAAWVKSLAPHLKTAAGSGEELRWNLQDELRERESTPDKQTKVLPEKREGGGRERVWMIEQDFNKCFDDSRAYIKFPGSERHGNDPDRTPLYVVERAGNSKVDLFVFGKDVSPDVLKAAAATPVVEVTLHDSANDEIDGVQYSSFPNSDSGGDQLKPTPFLTERGYTYIWPYVGWGYYRHAPGFCYDFYFTLPLEKLKAVKSVRAKIYSRSAPE